MAIDHKLIDELLKDYKKPEDITGEDGLLKQLTKALVERAMQAEMKCHLGYAPHAASGRNSGNSRNGKYSKTIQGNFGQATIEVPRDREGKFEPQIIEKGQKRFDGFDDKIISLYARGMTVRQIQQHLEEIYGVDVSPSLISAVTDEISQEVTAWQTRPLQETYAIVYLDSLFVKIRDEGQVRNKALYLALGVTLEGKKEALGLWLEQTEGAKFWLRVLTEIQNRGVRDIMIVCVDGLSGFPEAIEAVYPKAQVQGCLVHMVRNSLRFVPWKDRKAVAADLKPIYQAPTREAGELALEAFAKKWDEKYPLISPQWRKRWALLSPFFEYPAEIRRVIYTTNAIESLNMSLRKILKVRGGFPNDEAALKLVYLALDRASRRWTMPVQNWKQALNRLAIIFAGRIPEAA